MSLTATFTNPEIQPDLFTELAPVVKRAARKMAQKYVLRLAQRRVICPEDLENVGWARVLAQLERIERRPTANERAAYTYTLVCGAIHNEFSYIATGGDDANRLTHNGTLDTGAKDSSYDGGSSAFSADDAAPIAAQPSCEYWTPPVVWDVWQKMNVARRDVLLTKVLHDEDYKKVAFESPLRYLLSKWNEIPFHIQEWIESVWKRTAKGALRRNRNASGTAPRNPYGFISTALPHPDELGQITPPRLRAVALLVYKMGYYADGGESINSSEISKILGKSARTVLRDHTELMKLWGAYVRADAVVKRDETKFPRYPLHTNIAQEFSNMPANAQMPVPYNPVIVGMAMTADRTRDLYQRMAKYHTNFSDATVTATIVTPRAILYECGPRPSAFKIIAGFETHVPESDGHSQTIDSFARKPSPNDSRIWIPIVCRDGVKQPILWLHDWSTSDAASVFGDRPEVRKDDGRAKAAPIYPGSGLGESPARLVNTLTSGWGGCGGGSSIVTPQYFPLVMPLLAAGEQRAMFYRLAHKKPPFTRVGNWTQTRQLCPLYLTTQRSTSVALYPREQDATKPVYCQCPLCREMRREDQRRFDTTHLALRATFGELTPYSTIEDNPLRRNARRIGIMHGFDTLVGNERIRKTHFVCDIRGAELWTVEDFGKKFYVLTPPLPRPAHVESPYPHDWSDTIEVIETTKPYHLSAEEIALIADKEERELRARLRERKYAGHVHRVLNPHVLDCGESQTVSEIVADYRSDERKQAAKANAAHSAASREHNAWILADTERTHEADDRIHSVLVAQGQQCRRPGCRVLHETAEVCS